jgi:hypothetical protein
MDRATAIKKLGKLLGKNLGYRVDPTAPLQHERDEARAEFKEAIKVRDALEEHHQRHVFHDQGRRR